MENHIISLKGNREIFNIQLSKEGECCNVVIKNWETIEHQELNTQKHGFFERTLKNISINCNSIIFPNFIKISNNGETLTIEQLQQFPQMYPCELHIDLDQPIIFGDLSISVLKCEGKLITVSKTLLMNNSVLSNSDLIISNGAKVQINEVIEFKQVNIINNGVVLCKNQVIIIGGSMKNGKDGLIETNSYKIEKTNHENHGELTSKKFEQLSSDLQNYGMWFHEGDSKLQDGMIENQGNIEWKNSKINTTTFSCGLNNSGYWILENVSLENGNESLHVTNSKTLHFKNCNLHFNCLVNYGNVIINSGNYIISKLNNSASKSSLISLLDNDWFINDDALSTQKRTNCLCLVGNTHMSIGNIEVEKDLIYSVKKMPDSLTVGQNLLLSQQQSLIELTNVKCGGTVNMRYNIPANVISSQVKIANINHLSLTILGDVTNTDGFTVSSCTLNIKGSFTNLNTINTTIGNLEIHADGNIDNTKGKISSKGNLVLISGKDILNGEAKSGGSFLYTFNGSYIASCGTLTLAASGVFNNKYGQVFSSKAMNVSGNSISNIAGDIACGSDITFTSKTFNNSRDSVYTVNIGNWTWAYTGCYNHYESSDQAIIRALGNICLRVDQGTNSASSILAQKEIKFKHKERPKIWFAFGSMKTEIPSTFTNSASTLWGYGCNDKVGYQRGGSPISNYSATIQSGQKITIETDHFSMSGSMSSPVIKIQCKSADFDNQVRYRTNIPQETIYIDLTKFIQERVQYTGLLKNKDGNIECDIDLGNFAHEPHISLIDDCDEHKKYKYGNVPFHNPLKNLPSDFMDLYIQSALSMYAGKLYLNGKGNSLTEKLLANSDLFKQETHKMIMNKRHQDNPKYAMLLGELQQVNDVIQKNTILYLPANEINPYQSSGDIAANEFTCNTSGDQTHANNRIVARDVLCVMAKNVTRRTESYISVNYVNDSKITEDISMPKQTFICLNGDINIKASQTIMSTGTTTIGNDVNQNAKEIIEKPLVLHKVVETKHESGSFINKKETVETNTSHSIVTNENIARNNLTKQAVDQISQTSTYDIAGQKSEYDAKTTNISGSIINDTQTRESTKTNGFTEQTSKSYNETATFHSASITTPITVFKGDSATLSGCDVTGKTIEDHTKDGVKFKPVVGEVHYSVQETIESPLAGVDAGCKGGSTVLLECRLDVEKIVRMIEGGEILFDTVIWKKQKPEIIGKATEITTEIRQWHTSWCKTHQTVPDGAIIIASLAVSFATYGAGATLVGATGTWGAMSSAAFTTLCNAATTSFLESGDIIMSAKVLITTDFYRSLAISVASSGIINFAGLNIKLYPNSSTILDYAKYAALKSIVNVPLNCVIGKRQLNEVLVNEAANIVTDTITGYTAGQIGLMYRDGDLSFMNHKFYHGIAGGLSGGITNIILNKDMIEGAISGAIAATISEISGELNPLNCDINSADHRLFISKVIAGSVALLMKKDVNLAVKIASITVENNLWFCLPYLNAILISLGITHAAKDAMDIYEETGDVNDLVDTFMLHGIIESAVNGVVRIGGRVFGMYKNVWKSGSIGMEVIGTQGKLSASSVINKDLLHHQLSLQERMGETGKALAGAGTNKVFRNEPRIVGTYGGKIGEWAKKSSSNFVTNGGKKIEVHWVENVKTGQKVEFKQKLLN